MDVNVMGNNMNIIKVYSTGNDLSQYSNDNILVNKSTEAIGNKQVESSQDNKEGFDKKELDKAIKKLNKFLEDEKTHAEYSIHKDLKTLMVKIVDDTTKEVVLEIPPQKILDMIAFMCKQVGILDKKA
ncbi:flagellar protein FlaG [Clostridium beijerinckii]|uniref:Flagellar protein FlaG n=1 Tax=Clostridium beijerinckii TaxID=1520 RepID=A0AAW3W760_CLOBE|nr:flagellar protein FlaG [Clostridium beijerinckii]MBC2455911.1 flagellar protein FlaG [Clostridium beijerinckii]MBC2474716.1 flagellar protein FlaG [Clostridium beijerinckii]MDG5852866.1 flagellar protein FlaG [Clostridium beijerinckii]NOV61866.1 flagellar protein FlaG [Clostridium beijerinckii]NOV68638.1 flagellar protein FlaG [Clostridium beijerinckii]